MTAEDLEAYVRENLSKGYPPESIKETLRASGHDSAIVDRIINSQQQSPVQPQQSEAQSNMSTVRPAIPSVNEVKPKKSAKWIKIIAVLDILLGLLYVLFGIAIIALTSVVVSIFGEQSALFGLGFGVVGALVMIMGIVGIISGVGLFKMKLWGYNATLAYLIMETIIYLFNSSYVMVIVNVFILYYIYKSRELFSK